jgi:hypothetical protein
MKKAKMAFWSIVIILVVLVIAGVTVASAFLGPVVKEGIDTFGPRITKVPVGVEGVHLSLLTGSASVKGLVVGNPEGYQSPQAISAGMIAVGVNPISVLSDKIVLRSIRLESPEITFEGSLRGNNLSQILDNVSGSAQTAAQTGGAVSTGTNAAPSKKYEVDDLLITGAKVHVILTDLGGKEMTLPLPPIHLTDLGKNKNGITVADLSRSVLNAIVATTVKAVANAGTRLGKNAEQLIINAGKNEAVSNVTRGLNNLLGK